VSGEITLAILVHPQVAVLPIQRQEALNPEFVLFAEFVFAYDFRVLPL
jgi:hypothetical protein